MKGCPASCTTGIFPFCFTGEAVGSLGMLSQALTKFNRILPSHSFDWKTITFNCRRIRIRFTVDLRERSYCSLLGLGHRILAHAKRANDYCMLRTFAVREEGINSFMLWRPIRKLPSGISTNSNSIPSRTSTMLVACYCWRLITQRLPNPKNWLSRSRVAT